MTTQVTSIFVASIDDRRNSNCHCVADHRDDSNVFGLGLDREILNENEMTLQFRNQK
jgi:hypothetical protein